MSRLILVAAAHDAIVAADRVARTAAQEVKFAGDLIEVSSHYCGVIARYPIAFPAADEGKVAGRGVDLSAVIVDHPRKIGTPDLETIIWL